MLIVSVMHLPALDSTTDMAVGIEHFLGWNIGSKEEVFHFDVSWSLLSFLVASLVGLQRSFSKQLGIAYHEEHCYVTLMLNFNSLCCSLTRNSTFFQLKIGKKRSPYEDIIMYLLADPVRPQLSSCSFHICHSRILLKVKVLSLSMGING